MEVLVGLNWLTTTSIVGAIITLVAPHSREAIARYVAGFVQAGFDKEISKLNSDLRNIEEQFSSELRQREARQNSIVEFILSGKAARQSALDSRKLQAIERLWLSKAKFDHAKFASSIMSAIDFEKAAKEGSKDIAVQKYFKQLDGVSGFNKILEEGNDISCESERPFVSDEAWLAHRAYTSTLMLAVMRLKFLTVGAAGAELIKEEPTNKLLAAALPQHSDYVEKYGSAGHHYLLEPLELHLLQSVKEMLNGSTDEEVIILNATKAAKRVIEAEASLFAPPPPSSIAKPSVPPPPESR